MDTTLPSAPAHLEVDLRIGTEVLAHDRAARVEGVHLHLRAVHAEEVHEVRGRAVVRVQAEGAEHLARSAARPRALSFRGLLTQTG